MNTDSPSFFSSLVRQSALLMALFCVLALGSMALSTWLTLRVQGNAHAINKSGTLRMQSYRLLATLSLSPDANVHLRTLADSLEADMNSKALSCVLERESLENDLLVVQNYWRNDLRPNVLRSDNTPQAISLIASQVEIFVQRIDAMVANLEKKTEQHIQQTIILQKVFMVLSLLFLVAFFIYLRQRIVLPLRQLLGLASAIQHRDFKQRADLRYHDELYLLAQTLNTAAQDLEQSYHSLEARIAEKTTDLQQKNETLAFLYEALRALHHRGLYDSHSLRERLDAILDRVRELLPFDSLLLILDRQTSPHVPETSSIEVQRWPLADAQTAYGWIEGRQASDTQIPLTEEHRRLMSLLADAFTVTLVLEDQEQQREQWLLTEERTAIASELHDSIAQSLSYLKLRLASLQMHQTLPAEELSAALTEMRDEVNVAYRQLRELLTTFRLQLDQPGLDAALMKTVAEFSPRLGFPIALDNQLHTLLPANKTIHLLQIAREALHNIEKHAQATAASLKVFHTGDDVVMRIIDNGRGLPEEQQRRHHYGLAIMRDRAQSLGGTCNISNRLEGGVEVRVDFKLPFEQVPPDNPGAVPADEITHAPHL